MTLQTKSVQKKASPKDGIRVCIMRRPGDYLEWDLWLPKLSPSNELLDEYKKQGLAWPDFQKKFRKQVLSKQTRLIKMLGQLSQQNVVTLLCWEETADYCHRKLVAEAYQKLFPEAKVVLK